MMGPKRAVRPSSKGDLPIPADRGDFDAAFRDRMVREQAERVKREAPDEVGDARKGNQFSGGVQREEINGRTVLVYVRWRRWYWRLPTEEWQRAKRAGYGPFPTREESLVDARARLAVLDD